MENDPATFWHDQFLYALSGLSWAVGRLGDDAGYAGVVHDRLTHPTVHFPATVEEPGGSPVSNGPFGV
jgi:hypothetical protein